MVVAATLAAGPLRAQTDSVRRDSSRVMLAPITVTASRIPAPRAKIGTALDIITPETLDREPPRNAAAALAWRPGIILDEAAGPGGPTVLRLRGGEEVFGQILMDGVQVNQNGGFFDFQGLMLTNVERIEVARGPQSALYGSTAVNGVVQFITRAGHDGPTRLGAELAGSDASVYGGAARGSITARGGGARVRWSGGLGAAYDRGIYALPHDIRTHEASLRLDALARSGLTITAVGRFVGMDANLPVRDPGATRVPLDPNARNERDRFIGSLHGTFRTGSFGHRIGAGVYREVFTFDDMQDGVSDPNFFVFDANFTLDSRLLRTTVDYLATMDASLRGAPLGLALGAQWEREALHDRTGGDFGSDTLRLARGGGALFAEARAGFGERLSVLAGARAEAVEGLEAEVSPRATVLLDLPAGWTLRAAAGRAFKAPNLQQQFLDNPFIVANPGLRPETSWSWELGMRAQPADALAIEATVFRQQYTDLIRTVRSDTDTTRQVNRNIGSARAVGVELEAAWASARGLRVEASGTWIRTTVLDNVGLNPAEYPLGRPLPFRPAVAATGMIAVPVGSRVNVALRGTLVGQQLALSERFGGRRVKLGAYGLVGVTGRVGIARDVSAFARIENLFDHRFDTGFDRRGLPRTATLGIRIGD